MSLFNCDPRCGLVVGSFLAADPAGLALFAVGGFSEYKGGFSGLTVFFLGYKGGFSGYKGGFSNTRVVFGLKK